MKSFQAIYGAYSAVNGHLVSQEAAANSPSRKDFWSRQRIMNDQAYYVVPFAQLEDHIDRQCKRLVARKQSSPRWASRRLWDTADVDRLTFKNRVALLAEKNGVTYNKVLNYYKHRCDIAHGTVLAAMPIAIATFAVELQALARQLRAR